MAEVLNFSEAIASKFAMTGVALWVNLGSRQEFNGPTPCREKAVSFYYQQLCSSGLVIWQYAFKGITTSVKTFLICQRRELQICRRPSLGLQILHSRQPCFWPTFQKTG